MKIAVLTGAGMSQESGLSTFRDSGGLWDRYDIYEVATPEAFEKDPRLVLSFYNERRKQLLEVEPNKGHKILADLESHFEVEIITQNIDNLHERAGSSNVLHLHGELTKSRSTRFPNNIYDIEGSELNIGDLCEYGSQLRPHVVWFGEEVPMIPLAEEKIESSDILIIVGTSLNVYPAAGLIHSIKADKPVYLVDPAEMDYLPTHVNHIKEKATKGLHILNPILLQSIGL